ncbi:hypothetical protein LCGC14_0466150 [marine sediment metagenome]|uniref:Uncharacterized protein n=1 Tax=marine sediment metagenome TaxID=412755 RepID=A0A0F9SDK2_9ZZZZ
MAEKSTAIADKAKKKESTRRKFRDENWTEEQVIARRAKLTVKELPEGWIKLAHVADVFREKKIAVSRLVRATGGDRGMYPPKDPVFRIVYFNGARYLHPDVLTAGISLMADPNYGKVPRKKKAKTDKAASKTSKKKAAPQAKKATVKSVGRPSPLQGQKG